MQHRGGSPLFGANTPDAKSPWHYSFDELQQRTNTMCQSTAQSPHIPIMAAAPPNFDCHHYASASEQKNEAIRAAWIDSPGHRSSGHRSKVLQQQGPFYNNDTTSHRRKDTAWCFAALCCGLTIVCLAIWFAVHHMVSPLAHNDL